MKYFAVSLDVLPGIPEALEEMLQFYGKLLSPCILSGIYRHNEDSERRMAFLIDFDGVSLMYWEDTENPVTATNHFQILPNPESWGEHWYCPRLDAIQEKGQAGSTLIRPKTWQSSPDTCGGG